MNGGRKVENDQPATAEGQIVHGQRVLELGVGAEACHLKKLKPDLSVTALDRPADSQRPSSVEMLDAPSTNGNPLPPPSLPLYRRKLEDHGIVAVPHLLPEPLPFEENQFDVVYSRFSLYNFSEDVLDELVLIEIRRVLKPGGALVFMVKTKENLSTSTGKVLFSPEVWEELLTKSCFLKVSSKPESRPEAVEAGEPWTFVARV
eukprot:Skav218597  [mRNA]  locus=scaffold3628:101364:101975:+ [translate_table: standard]